MDLRLGNCIEVLKTIPENSIDSIVTDPPYELGFMGKKWDSSGIAFNTEVWIECLRALKPGGHLLAFGGSRTYHRMACAIEDAGFEIRDQIQWIYGSGFPKSLNVGKAIDELLGNNRDKILNPLAKKQTGQKNTNSLSGDRNDNIFITKGTSEWEGWGTALKPAHEPIVVARKPIEGTVAQNVLKYGTGGLNIDGCRIHTEEQITNHSRSSESAISKGKYGDSCEQGTHQTLGQKLGRFPANVIHDGSEEVVRLFPNSKTNFIEKQSDCNIDGNTSFHSMRGNRPSRGYDGDGSAARFFYCAKASKSERDEGCEYIDESIRQNPMRSANGVGEKNFIGGFPDIKARNNHPTVKPVKLMQYLVKLITRPGGTVLDPFMGSGTTGVACKKDGYEFIGIEMDAKYFEICEARIGHAQLDIPEPTNQLSLF